MTLRVLPASAESGAVFGNPFRVFEYREHSPLVYLDQVKTGLFLEEREFVTTYRQLLSKISSIALENIAVSHPDVAEAAIIAALMPAAAEDMVEAMRPGEKPPPVEPLVRYQRGE